MADSQQLSVNGIALSNNDPDLVITLDDHPVVQISSIQESTITYSFATDVETVQTYNLNLTFTYKGVLTKVIPLTFIHNPKPVPIVVTDVPITAATMWAHDNTIPFTVSLDGTDVTNQLTNIILVPNTYIRKDRTIGDKKLWSVENAESTPTSVETQFNFNLTYENKTRTLSGKGTFNIPAWNGLTMWPEPTTPNDPLFTDLRIKVGQTVRVYLMPKFRGVAIYDDSSIFSKPALNDLSNGLVTFALETGHWSYGRPVLIRGDKVGTGKPKLSLLLSNVDPGYTGEVLNETMTYWSPNVEVWDDVLEASTTTVDRVSAKKNDTFSFDLGLKFNGETLNTNTSGVTISFAPNDVLSFVSATTTGVTAKVIKDVPYSTDYDLTVTATYQGKTATVPLKVRVMNEQVTATLDANSTFGGTNDTFSITPTVMYNNVAQPIDNSVNVVDISADNGTLIQLVNRNNGKLNFKVLDTRPAPQSYVVTLTFTVNGVSTTATFTHNYKVKPTLVPVPVNTSVMSTGNAPFSFTVNGSAVTPTIDSVTLSASQYVEAVGTKGNWKVIKADDTEKVENVTFTINITHDGVEYSYSQAIAFTIATLGSTVTATSIIGEADMTLDKESQVVFSLVQTLNGQSVTLDPVFENTTVTGTATFVNLIPHPDNAGQYILTVKGKGTAGAFTLASRLHNRVGGELDGTLTYPFSIAFTTAKKTESTVTMTAVGSTELTPVQQNTLTVSLKYGNNNAVVGAEAQSLVLTPTPNSTAVIPSYRTTLTPVSGQPGQYTVDLDAGHLAGSVGLTLTILVDGATYPVDNTLTFTNPGAPVNATPLTIELNNTNDQVSPIEFSLSQSRFGTTDHDFTGATFKSLVVSGAAKAVGTPTAAGSGKFTVDVTASGTTGPVSISGTVVDADAHEYPFSFNINADIPSGGVALTGVITSMLLDLWEQDPITYRVIADGRDVTSTSTVSDVAITNNGEYVDFIEISDGLWGFKAIKADPLEDVTLQAKVNVNVRYDGVDYDLPIELEITILANTTGIPVNRFDIEIL